jgi:hypothetical protein
MIIMITINRTDEGFRYPGLRHVARESVKSITEPCHDVLLPAPDAMSRMENMNMSRYTVSFDYLICVCNVRRGP